MALKTLYTTTMTATGGRTGQVTAPDGSLMLDLASPKELGGPGGATNPEQLFAAGYAACFHSALSLVAKHAKADPSDSSVTGTVSLGANAQGGYGLAVTLTVDLPKVERETALALVEKAHTVCPYSNATRGNIDVELIVK